LAEVFLMHANDRAAHRPAVVTIHDDGGLVAEVGDPRARGDEPRPAGRIEAEVLIQIVIVEAGNRRLEDVRRGRRTGRDTPAPVLEEKGGLRLGSGEAELAGEGLAEPGRRVQPELPKALRDTVVGEPGDLAGADQDAVDLLGRRDSYGPGAVLADRRAEE
jgi:hypothetical protein